MNLLYNQVINDIRFDDSITLLENRIEEKTVDLLTNEKISILPSKEIKNNSFKTDNKSAINSLCLLKQLDNKQLLQVSNEMNLSENKDELNRNKDEEICKTKSVEEIFTDITKQCGLLTGIQEKPNIFNLYDYIHIGSVVDDNDPYNINKK